MIKLVDLLNEKQNIEELGAKDIALGAAMAASSMFGGAKAQSKIPTDKPATTQQVTKGKTNPNFWVKDTNDIKSVQKAIKDYRVFSIARWKKGRQGIKMSGQEMNPGNPEDVDRVEKNYMLWCLGTSEDGKNGKYTSQFEFPGAFLEDKDTKEREDLGLKGNKQMTSTSSSSGITVQQMKEWNDYVKWMKDNGYSGKEDMDHADFRDNVLKQYKGQVKESKMTKQQLREAIRKIIKAELDENQPAPSKPTEKPGPAVAPGKPGEKEGPRRPLGNPNVRPAPKAIKATMKEAEMLKKVIQRFKAKKNA
jgi:hypothetical protein